MNDVIKNSYESKLENNLLIISTATDTDSVNKIRILYGLMLYGFHLNKFRILMGLDNIRKTSSRLDQMENGHYDDLFKKK